MSGIPKRECIKCGVIKPLSENYYRSFKRKRGRGWPKKCRQCQAEESRARLAERQPEARQDAYAREKERGEQAAFDKRRDYHLRRKYGITIEDYERMMREGGGVCWICGTLPKNTRLHVDHDHKTGHVRGLLCWQCNTAIGKFGDDPDKLMRAAAYLVNAAEKGSK